MSKKVIFTDRNDSLLDSYLKDIAKYKVLDKDLTNELVLQAQQGDLNARDKVIRANLRFVVSVAKQFQNRGVPLMDLVSSGNEGLIKAISLFDPTKGVVFLSYAVWWIRQSIFKSIYWQGKIIRLPMSQQNLVNSIASASEKFLKEHNRNPNSVEISEMTGIPIEQIDFLSQFSNKLVFIDDFIGGDEENNQVCDVIPDNGPSLDDILNKKYINEELDKILNKLPIREQDLLRMYFGIGLPKVSSSTIASMYGVCHERIRQLRETALAKIRKKYKASLTNML